MSNLEWNKGMIIGVTRNAEGDARGKTMVNLRGIAQGVKRKPIYYPNGGHREITNLNVYSDKNGRYRIPFLWNKADYADFMDGKITVNPRAFLDNSSRHSGRTEPSHGRLGVASDTDSLISSILPMLPSGTTLASIAGFKLPSAMKTVFNPKLSMLDMVAFAYCDLWLPKPI